MEKVIGEVVAVLDMAQCEHNKSIPSSSGECFSFPSTHFINSCFTVGFFANIVFRTSEPRYRYSHNYY